MRLLIAALFAGCMGLGCFDPGQIFWLSANQHIARLDSIEDTQAAQVNLMTKQHTAQTPEVGAELKTGQNAFLADQQTRREEAAAVPSFWDTVLGPTGVLGTLLLAGGGVVVKRKMDGTHREAEKGVRIAKQQRRERGEIETARLIAEALATTPPAP